MHPCPEHLPPMVRVWRLCLPIPQSANAIDRYWDIKTNAAVNANLTFSYRGVEKTITGSGNCPTDTLKAQNWNGGTWNPLVGPGNPGVTLGFGTVGPVPFNSYAFSLYLLLCRLIRVLLLLKMFCVMVVPREVPQCLLLAGWVLTHTLGAQAEAMVLLLLD